MRRCQQPWPAGGRAGVLSFPVVADPTHPPIRPERHAPTSIPTMRRRLTVGLARRLPRCPCCQTPHSEQVLLIQPLLLSALWSSRINLPVSMAANTMAFLLATQRTVSGDGRGISAQGNFRVEVLVLS